MGKVNNQKFVAIPHARFIDKVKYKAQAYGIKVIVREESYTSKASALDFDAIPDYRADGESVKGKFSGNRVKRGLYRAADGTEINADINGALNIARKELGDEWLKKQLKANGSRLFTVPPFFHSISVLRTAVSKTHPHLRGNPRSAS